MHTRLQCLFEKQEGEEKESELQKLSKCKQKNTKKPYLEVINDIYSTEDWETLEEVVKFETELFPESKRRELDINDFRAISVKETVPKKKIFPMDLGSTQQFFKMNSEMNKAYAEKSPNEEVSQGKKIQKLCKEPMAFYLYKNRKFFIKDEEKKSKKKFESEKKTEKKKNNKFLDKFFCNTKGRVKLFSNADQVRSRTTHQPKVESSPEAYSYQNTSPSPNTKLEKKNASFISSNSKEGTDTTTKQSKQEEESIDLPKIKDKTQHRSVTQTDISKSPQHTNTILKGRHTKNSHTIHLSPQQKEAHSLLCSNKATHSIHKTNIQNFISAKSSKSNTMRTKLTHFTHSSQLNKSTDSDISNLNHLKHTNQLNQRNNESISFMENNPLSKSSILDSRQILNQNLSPYMNRLRQNTHMILHRGQSLNQSLSNHSSKTNYYSAQNTMKSNQHPEKKASSTQNQLPDVICLNKKFQFNHDLNENVLNSNNPNEYLNSDLKSKYRVHEKTQKLEGIDEIMVKCEKATNNQQNKTMKNFKYLSLLEQYKHEKFHNTLKIMDGLRNVQSNSLEMVFFIFILHTLIRSFHTQKIELKKIRKLCMT